MPRTVYLADRDRAFRRRLSHALAVHGLEVLEFTRGSELFEAALLRPPDFLVAELDLDVMDGLQVVEWLGRERPGAAERVAILSSSASPSVVHACVQRGALACLDKGAPLAALAASIASLSAPAGHRAGRAGRSAELEQSGAGAPWVRSSAVPVAEKGLLAPAEAAEGSGPTAVSVSRAEAERAEIAALRERWHARQRGPAPTSPTRWSRRGLAVTLTTLVVALTLALGLAVLFPGRAPAGLAARLDDLGRLAGVGAPPDDSSGPALEVSSPIEATTSDRRPGGASAAADAGDGALSAPSTAEPGTRESGRVARASGGPGLEAPVSAREARGESAEERGRPGDGVAAPPGRIGNGTPGVITTEVVPIEDLPVAAGAPDGAYGLSAIRGRPQYVYVDAPAVLETRIRPRYPRLLADRKVGGSVTLWVLVSQIGSVAETRVLRSSGYPELDQAAIQAVRPARYRPAQRGGTAVPTWTQQQIVFRLE